MAGLSFPQITWVNIICLLMSVYKWSVFVSLSINFCFFTNLLTFIIHLLRHCAFGEESKPYSDILHRQKQTISLETSHQVWFDFCLSFLPKYKVRALLFSWYLFRVKWCRRVTSKFFTRMCDLLVMVVFILLNRMWTRERNQRKTDEVLLIYLKLGYWDEVLLIIVAAIYVTC